MPRPGPAVRALTETDVDAVVDLFDACEVEGNGIPDPELRDWLRSSGLRTVTAFGLDDDAGLVAAGYVECSADRTGLEADVRVRPGSDYSVADPVLARLRRVAAEFDSSKPVRLMTNERAAAQHRWLREHGATEIRRFWRMAIDLEIGGAAAPTPPPGVHLRPVADTPADLQRVHELIDAAFAGHFGRASGEPFERWMRGWRDRPGFDLSLWWVAELEDEPVGVLLALTLEGEGHVRTVGTLPPARGRGIASLLLRTAFAEFHRRGLTRVTLNVDSENGTGAVRLYESVGMRDVLQWTLYELPPLGAG